MARNKRAAQDTETAASAAKKSKKDENKVEVIATRFLSTKFIILFIHLIKHAGL